MALGNTYGINFPFADSQTGKYLFLTQTADEEIRTDLIHLLLTRKGTRGLELRIHSWWKTNGLCLVQ